MRPASGTAGARIKNAGLKACTTTGKVRLKADTTDVAGLKACTTTGNVGLKADATGKSRFSAAAVPIAGRLGASRCLNHMKDARSETSAATSFHRDPWRPIEQCRRLPCTDVVGFSR